MFKKFKQPVLIKKMTREIIRHNLILPSKGLVKKNKIKSKDKICVALESATHFEQIHILCAFFKSSNVQQLKFALLVKI